MTEQAAELALERAQEIAAAFTEMRLLSSKKPGDETFAPYWNKLTEEEEVLDYDKSLINRLGKNHLLNLALFVPPGLLVKEGKKPGGSQDMCITCCQLDLSAKRIHKLKDLALAPLSTSILQSLLLPTKLKWLLLGIGEMDSM